MRNILISNREVLLQAITAMLPVVLDLTISSLCPMIDKETSKKVRETEAYKKMDRIRNGH